MLRARRVASLTIPTAILTSTILTSVALVSGCYESFPRGVADAGALDAAPRDADGPDAREPDASEPDAGVCARGELVRDYEGPGCAAATLGCLEACRADTAPPGCSDGCIAVDPECTACFDQTLIACTNRRSCQGRWDAFACCTERECEGVGAGAARLACAAEGACLNELEAYAGCADDSDLGPCEVELARCFE